MIQEKLTATFGDRLKFNELMSKHINFRIGGPASYFIEVKTLEELQSAVQIAIETNTPYFILGGGSNTLVSDTGFDGLAIKMANRDYRIEGNKVIAGAGALSVAVARGAGGAGLTGLEWMVSLPGTIGGAVRGNAGCFGGDMSESVDYVKALRISDTPCKIVELSNEDLAFGYRTSSIKTGDDIVFEVVMKLEEGDVDEIHAREQEILSKRKSTQHIASGTAGCAFKNIEFSTDDEIEKLRSSVGKIPQSFIKKKQIGSGWVVDRLDLKGFQIGQIKISEEHGNFLLNLGGATADDVVQMIAYIKTKARDEFGLQLQEEIEYVGF